jgi:hypothetical protein
MGDVVELKFKDKVHVIKFTCPSPLLMRKTGAENIALEINRVDEFHGFGTAWIYARNINEAKRKLMSMIEIKEWVED